MMNLILMLAFSVLLPASTICGATVSEPKSLYNNEFDSLHPILAETLTKSNSSDSLTPNVIVKREIPEANEMPYYHIPTAIMSKRSATVLNKLMFALRNSFDKPVSVSMDNELGSRENDNFAGDVSQALAKVNTVDRFPAALVERRGQKDRKIYLRCYFNAVSCFKKK